MTRQSCAHHQFCGHLVAGLTHQNHIRVLTQKGPQARRETQTDIIFHLRLPNQRHPVFNRILKRKNTALLSVDHAQQCIERRGFTATGGTGNQKHPVGLIQNLGELGLLRLRKSQSR